VRSICLSLSLSLFRDRWIKCDGDGIVLLAKRMEINDDVTQIFSPSRRRFIRGPSSRAVTRSNESRVIAPPIFHCDRSELHRDVDAWKTMTVIILIFVQKPMIDTCRKIIWSRNIENAITCAMTMRLFRMSLSYFNNSKSTIRFQYLLFCDLHGSLYLMRTYTFTISINLVTLRLV